MSAGAATGADAATAAAAAATEAGTKPRRAADDKGKPVEAEALPKAVVKPRRDRKVGTVHQPYFALQNPLMV